MAVIILKLECRGFTIKTVCLKDAGRIANTVDPEQNSRSGAA